MQRHISLDIYDYSGHALCNLYDSSNNISGQATDVIVHTERNGFKEIRFKLPSTCMTEEEEEKNYRLDYLVNDYRLRIYEETYDIINGLVVNRNVEIDWFLVSESKVTHSNFSTDFEIRAGHISQLLNTKNLNLEFSDEEGNNTGTIRQIAETILEGTGWELGYVAEFKEEDKYDLAGKEKVRSFNASPKTGAFKMMNNLCELFDAKPIYHGEGRTVDIIPMNPFSEKLEEGTIPPDLNENKIIEIYYDKNLKNITRTLNSDSLVTVFYAYGSYGDKNGLASLQKAEHAEITFGTLEPGEYRFEYQNAKYYFTTNIQTTGLKWSSLDFVSRSYVFDGEHLFKVYKTPNGTSQILTVDPVYVKNEVSCIMDFSYYQKIGLLTDEMLLKLAQAQTTLPTKHIIAQEASLSLSDVENSLSRTASSGTGFLMLDVSESNPDIYGNTVLTIKTSEYEDGVIFRSDYLESKRNYFTWNTATGIKDSGEAIAGKGSVVYIVHERDQNNPTKWEKAYIKALGNLTNNYYRDNLNNIYNLITEEHYDRKESSITYPSDTFFPAQGEPNVIYIADNTRQSYAWVTDKYVEIQASPYYFGRNEFDYPKTITLWSTNSNYWQSGDKVYLFSSDSIAGLFGPREDSVLSNRKAIEEATKVATETHPLYFITDNESLPSSVACENSYGWCYKTYTNQFEFGKLYFRWGVDGDLGWNEVMIYYGSDNPEKMQVDQRYLYLYSIKRMMLYKIRDDAYVPINNTVNEEKVTSSFAAVIDGCINQDYLTKGVCEQYNYTDALEAGINYAIKNEYNNYWLFTADRDVQSPSDVHYIPATKILWQDNDENHILKAVEYSFRHLNFPINNELENALFDDGSFSNDVFDTKGTQYISNNIYVHENTQYEFALNTNQIIPSEQKAIVVCLAENQNITGKFTTSPFTTPRNTTHIRIVYAVKPLEENNDDYLRVKDYDTVFFSENKQYHIINAQAEGERLGLSYLMNEFIRLSHEAYLVKLPELKQAQQDILDIYFDLSETLGDMYREGYWQENGYVEGDENKLYSDALDNLKEISHPQADYNISYLELYKSDNLVEDEVETDWPDIDITYAAHLVDTDIDTNRWAYIDSIDKCYDQIWKTKFEINTRLSMIGQQSFTDVLAKIAEVANETKAKQTIYEKASAISGSGQFAAERLEGMIQANKIYLSGGTSNWYTDTKGNIIFEASDNNSAMMLTGRGLMVANTKDQYGDWDWKTAISGIGINADEIATGEFSAKHITAGSITTDKLAASVGQELELGSNKSLVMYATVDGKRPAGSVETTDSLIEIKAADGNDPAQINILSGGEVNLKAGSVSNPGGVMNVESYGQLNLNGSTLNLNSSGKININAGSTLDIKASSEFLVNSPNFTIQKNQITNQYDVTVAGTITATGGTIAGYSIGTTQDNVHYLYSGNTQGMSSDAEGIYLGTDGINLGGKFKVTKAGVITATSGTIGSFTLDNSLYTNSKIDIDADKDGVFIGSTGIGLGARPTGLSRSAFKVTNKGKLYATGVDISGAIAATSGSIGSFTINSALYTNSKTGIDVNLEGVYIGSDGIGLGARPSGLSRSAFKITSAGKLYATGVDISGTIAASSGSVGSFTINSALYTNSKSAIDTNATGVYIGSDGISLGSRVSSSDTRSKFKVTSAGALFASSADIAGTIRASTLYIGNTQANISLDSSGHITMGSLADITIGSSSTKVQIDKNGITVRSSGSVDLSGASLTLSANQIPISKVNTGINISSAGIKLTGAQYIEAESSGHINLGVSNSNHVFINQDGIEIKGRRITLIDSNGDSCQVWGRDDIIVMNSNASGDDAWRRSVATIESHQTGKNDWVLIRPFPSAVLNYINTSTIYSGSGYGSFELTQTGTKGTFGDNANWYKYEISLEVCSNAQTASLAANITITAYLSNNSAMPAGTYVTLPVTSTAKINNAGYWNSYHNSITLTGSNRMNVCGENTALYLWLTTSGGSWGSSNVAQYRNVQLVCSCESTTTRVPCTVYYYP